MRRTGTVRWSALACNPWIGAKPLWDVRNRFSRLNILVRLVDFDGMYLTPKIIPERGHTTHVHACDGAARLRMA